MLTSWFATLFMVATLPGGLTKIFDNNEEDGIITDLKDMVMEDYVLDNDENIVKEQNSRFIEMTKNETVSESMKNNKNHGGGFKDIIAKTGEYQMSTEKYKVEEEERLGFTFQTSYFHSEVEEFVFSPWYFLIFSTVNKSSSLPAAISLISSEILESLSSKLSVPSSVFLVTSIVKYTSSDTFLSVNLSLVTPLIPNLHQELCNLHKKTHFFMIGGTMVELYQVRHQNNQHIYVTRNKVGSKENMQCLCFKKRYNRGLFSTKKLCHDPLQLQLRLQLNMDEFGCISSGCVLTSTLIFFISKVVFIFEIVLIF